MKLITISNLLVVGLLFLVMVLKTQSFKLKPELICKGKVADIVFVLDSSSSIWGEHFEKQLDFVKYMIDHLDVGNGPKQVRIGVETFSDVASVHINLNNFLDKTNLKWKIDQIPQKLGNTSIGDALMQLRNMFTPNKGARPNVRHVAIILTDGNSQDEDATHKEAKASRDANIELFVIGIGHYISRSELKGIASKPRSKYLFYTPSYEALDQIRDDVIQKTCEIVKPECKGKVADIVFVLDSSSSIWGEHFEKQLDFVKYMVDHLDVGNGPNKVRIGVETFSDVASVHINLNNFLDKTNLKWKIDQIPQKLGNTSIGDALMQLRNMFTPNKGARPNVRHVAIILTDGNSQDEDATHKEAKASRDANIELFVIGIGHYISRSELKGIASKPRSKYLFYTPSYKALDQIRDGVIQKTCEDVKPVLICKGKAIDIVFVLDSSSSIWREHFEKQLDFVKYMVDHFDVGNGPKQVQIGVETFSDVASVHINLNNYLDKTILKWKIDQIPQTLGNSNIGDALRQLRNNMFTPNEGARPNVRRVAIILTDGTSQDEDVTHKEAKACRDANIELFVIGIGHYISHSELKGIASKPKSKFLFHTPSYEALDQIRDDVIEEACNTSQSSEVMFMISNNHFGQKKSSLIQKASAEIIKRAESCSNVRFGVIFDDCPHNPDVTFGSITGKSRLNRELANFQFSSFISLLRKLRNTAFSHRSLNTRRIGFMFLDSTIDLNAPDIISEVQRIRVEFIELYAAIIGDVDQELVEKSLVPKPHIIKIYSYDLLINSLPSLFTEMICNH